MELEKSSFIEGAHDEALREAGIWILCQPISVPVSSDFRLNFPFTLNSVEEKGNFSERFLGIDHHRL